MASERSPWVKTTVLAARETFGALSIIRINCADEKEAKKEKFLSISGSITRLLTVICPKVVIGKKDAMPADIVIPHGNSNAQYGFLLIHRFTLLGTMARIRQMRGKNQQNLSKLRIKDFILRIAGMKNEHRIID